MAETQTTQPQQQQQQQQQWNGNLPFALKIVEPHHSEFLDVNTSNHTVDIHFLPGKQIFRSKPFELGKLYTRGGHTLTAYITFGYSYKEAEGEVTIAGTDFPSAEGMTLITTAEGTDEYCVLRSSNAGFMVEEGYDNQIWNCHSQLLAQGKAYLKQLVCDINEALIAAIEQIPRATLVVRHILPSFTTEEYRGLCSVFRDGYYEGTLEEVLDRTKADTVTFPESDYDGTTTFTFDEAFSNVVGSDCDAPVKSLSWIRLWEKDFGTRHVCASQNIPFTCSKGILGGHVIKGTSALPVAQGASNVRIIPICIKHNNNDGNYMVARKEQRVVKLKNYMVKRKKNCPLHGETYEALNRVSETAAQGGRA